jgi:hypothetical protein
LPAVQFLTVVRKPTIAHLPCSSSLSLGNYTGNLLHKCFLPCSSSLSLGNYTGNLPNKCSTAVQFLPVARKLHGKNKMGGAPSSHSLPHTNSFTKVRRTEGFGTKISSQKGTIHLADFHSDKTYQKYQTFGK